MQGANDYVRARQAFSFACPASLSIYDATTLTYDNTIRLRVAGALQNVASDVVVEFETATTSRTEWVVLKVAGRSRIDRARGADIRDDCLSAAQSAGLVVNNSQADINIYPADANVSIGYRSPDMRGGGGDDPSGMPSVETMLLIALGFVVVTKFLRG